MNSRQLTWDAPRKRDAVEQIQAELDSAIAEEQASSSERESVILEISRSREKAHKDEEAADNEVHKAEAELAAAQARLAAKLRQQASCRLKAAAVDKQNSARDAAVRAREKNAIERSDELVVEKAARHREYVRAAQLRLCQLQAEVARLGAWRSCLAASGEWGGVSTGDEACACATSHAACTSNHSPVAHWLVACPDTPSPAASEAAKRTRAGDDQEHAALETPKLAKRPRSAGASTSRAGRAATAEATPKGPTASHGIRQQALVIASSSSSSACDDEKDSSEVESHSHVRPVASVRAKDVVVVQPTPSAAAASAQQQPVPPVAATHAAAPAVDMDAHRKRMLEMPVAISPDVLRRLPKWDISEVRPSLTLSLTSAGSCLNRVQFRVLRLANGSRACRSCASALCGCGTSRRAQCPSCL